MSEVKSDYSYWSSGYCDECDECGDNTESEPWFSWQPCELCGSTLGGDRFPAHAKDNADDVIYHFEICVDCLMEL